MLFTFQFQTQPNVTYHALPLLRPSQALRDVAAFIGLRDDFDFEETVEKLGVYNHYLNTGYGRKTKWDELELKRRVREVDVEVGLRRRLVDFFKEWGEWDDLAEKCGWDG